MYHKIPLECNKSRHFIFTVAFGVATMYNWWLPFNVGLEINRLQLIFIMNYPDAFVHWVSLCVRTFDDILFNGESDGE